MSKLHKIWNKQTCYEIYFRPLPDTSKVEVISYHNGEPFPNPRSHRKDGMGCNTEVWDIQEARENWYTWVNHGGYEVSEVEDYLRPGSMNLQKRKRKSNVTMNGKPSSVSEVSKALKGMMAE